MDFDIIYYADDTVLFSRSNRGLNELFRLTKYISKGYGFRLNKGKCVATVAVNNDGATHFEDAAPLTKEFEAMYLGNEIDKTAKNNLILNKMSEVRRTRFKLEPYWKSVWSE